MKADMLNFIAVSSLTLYGVRGCRTPKDANRKDWNRFWLQITQRNRFWGKTGINGSSCGFQGNDEKLCCMIALGYGDDPGRNLKRKTVEQVSNASDITPAWFKKGVEAALLAPTAVNQQKFSFEYIGMKNNRHIVKASKGFSLIGYTKMDLGIAKCHFEVGEGDNVFDWS